MKSLSLSLALAGLLLFPAARAGASGPDEIIDSAVRTLRMGNPDSAAVLLYDLADGSGDNGDRVRAMYYLADALLRLGRNDEAIGYLVTASGLDSTSSFADDIRLAHAGALLAAGNVNGAISLAGDFIAKSPGSPLVPDMLLILGKGLAAREEWLRALNAFNEITGNHPRSPIAREASMMGGICLFHLQLPAAAAERFGKYLAQTPRGPGAATALYYLGRSHEDAGKPEAAARAFRTLATEHPSSPDLLDAWFRLGRNLFDTGRFDEAENAFHNYVENAPKTEPDYDDALFFLERIAFRKGRYSSEMEIAENFVAKYPASRLTPKLLLNLAWYYRLSGENERAIEKYQEILSSRVRTEYADSALFYEADTHVAMNSPDRAIAFLVNIAEQRRNPARAQAAYLKLGMIGERLNLRNEAIAWYDSAAAAGAVTDLTVRALLGTAGCYRDMNRWLESSRVYERILKNYPHSFRRADVHYSLAGVYYLMGRVYDAIQTAKEGLRYAKGKRRTDLVVFLADVYEYVDPDQAVRYYSDLASGTGSSPETRVEALIKIGDISVRRGDRRSAAEAYTKAVRSDTASFYREKARRKLDELNERDGTPGIARPQ